MPEKKAAKGRAVSMAPRSKTSLAGRRPLANIRG
jgi:hypothetical protein